MPASSPLVSTLADVLRLVPELFSRLGDGTPIAVGKRYLEEPGPGSAPRVVFVPEEKGTLGPPAQVSAGYIASWTHVCAVYVRGAEPGDDAGRFEPAYLLANRVIACLKALDPAHIVVFPGGPEDDSPLPVDGPGADVVFRFTYRRNVPQDQAVIRAAKQLTAVSPPDLDRPRGDTGNTFTVAASVTDSDRAS